MVLVYFILILGIVLLVRFTKPLERSTKSKEYIEEPEIPDESDLTPIHAPSDYIKKGNVLNPSERQFYLILQRMLENKYIVLSKVRIEDFIGINGTGLSWGKQQGLRGKIKSRHVDFLICDLVNTKPLLAIELDGSSHRNFKRRERDNFVNGVYKDIGLQVEHIHVGSNFATEAVRIKSLLSS